MDVFGRLEELERIPIWGGAEARAVTGDQITFAVIDLAPNSQVPEHRHANEQVGLVLKGEITLTVAGEARTLGPGATYVLKGEVPHSALTGPEGCSVVDTFSPVRSDWDAFPRLDPRPGAWPG
ncbi:MAG: cupin domain-containing protein [Candidatus Dormibacteraeota bacterium]|nr:cupin domain-containing protein [Candidatus Dormibacteraeota bacterium]